MPEYTPSQFAAVLLGCAEKAKREVGKVVFKGAMNVKRDARANVQRTAPIRNARAYTAIDFDTSPDGLSAEIGYNKELKPGRIGNLLEYGGGGDHSPPHHDLRLAMEAEEPGFVRALGDVAERAIE